MSRTIRLLTGSLVLLVALPAGAAKVYQWKDARGVTHYSDEPPPKGQDYRDRELANPPARPAPADATRPAEDPNCATARRNLEQLRSERPVGLDANGDGQPDKNMSAEERAQQVQQNERTLAAFCTRPAASR